MHKSAPVTLGMVALCLLLAWIGEPAAATLAWDRAAIRDGQLWRLWSGHLVHFAGTHAATDILGLLATGSLAESLAGPRRYAWVLAWAAAAVSLGLLLVPGLQEYRGASALAVTGAVLGGVLAWREIPASRPMLACAALALAGKTMREAGTRLAAFSELPAGVNVAWQAHLLGALAGLGATRKQIHP